jgi:hypothetical protein
MHYAELIAKVEDTIRTAVRQCYPMSWDEDHITYLITDYLAKLDKIEVTGLHRPFHIAWDARKFRGPTEKAFGDLGILVKLTSWDGEIVEGFALLEAKKRPLDSTSFTAVRKKQLTTIDRNAPHSRLLLYDHIDITEFSDNISMMRKDIGSRPLFDLLFSREENWLPFTQAVTVPVNLALTVGTYRTSLYKYSLPLSVQLCGRYFRGLDLEFDQKIIKQAKGFIDRYGGPRILLLVGIAPTAEVATSSREINDNNYTLLHDR